MKALGPERPTYGPKQTRKLHDRDVGIGGGPKSGKGRGPNRRDDPGEHGERAATAANNARSAKGTEMHKRVVDDTTSSWTGGNVKGQKADGPGKGGVGAYKPKHEGGGANKAEERVSEASAGEYSVRDRFGGTGGALREATGDRGRHSSVKGYEHESYKHTSKDR